MKKIISLITLTAIFMCSLCSCTMFNKRAELMKYQININGKDFTIPCPLSDFEEIGYHINVENQEVRARFGLICYLENSDGKRISITMYNPTLKERMLYDCVVARIKLDSRGDQEVILPGDLKFDASVTKEKIEQLYGKPDKASVDEFVHYTYTADDSGWREVDFSLFTQFGSYSYGEVEIQNYTSKFNDKSDDE